MRVRFPLAWFIKINRILKENLYKSVVNKKKSKFFYSFRFASLFYPGSLKNINLFIRSSINKDINISGNKNGSFKNNKILIKQSYLLAIWMHYLSKPKYKTPQQNTNQIVKLPAFFIHPYSQSKITTIKAPIGQKTFSQEQFLIRYYNISISFKPYVKENKNYLLNSVNESLYLSQFVRWNIPFISTNILFLKKISYSYNSYDKFFLSYYNFAKSTKLL